MLVCWFACGFSLLFCVCLALFLWIIECLRILVACVGWCSFGYGFANVL